MNKIWQIVKSERAFKLVRAIVITSLVAHFGIMMIKQSLGLPSGIGFWQGLSTSLLYSSVMLICQTLSLMLAEKYFPVKSKVNVIVHILLQSSVALFSFKLAQFFEILIFGFCNIPDTSFYIIVSVAFFLSLIWNTSYYLNIFYKQVQEANNAILESELKALKAQINPHFLFNTLNSIAALITINPKEAENVTVQLADLFRYSLKSSKTTWITLREEIEAINLYLYIEKVRFQERLIVNINNASAFDDIIIPSQLIMPLVENAIKHGANKVEHTFELTVELRIANDFLMCSVEDNGLGFDLSLGDDLFKRGTGLANIKDRLNLLYSKAGKMIINKNSVILILPIEKNSKAELTGFKHAVESN